MIDHQQFMMFSKHLQGIPLAEAAERVREIGITKLDLTVRPGGHIEPAVAKDALPAAAESLGRQGVEIGMITTNILDASDLHTIDILRTAASLGIRHYKLGYYRYKGFGTLRAQRSEIAAKLRDLVAVNLELGLHAGFHNHPDDFFGASVWDVDHVLTGLDPRAIGVYFDPSQATAEGGSGGWLMGLDLVQDRLTMLAVKDFIWADGKHRYAGARRHSIEVVPLAMGNTPWPAVIEILQTLDFQGPISFHAEYQGPFSWRDLSVDEVIKQTARDIKLFRKWMVDVPARRAPERLPDVSFRQQAESAC